jgi:glycerate-2-kinase
MKPVAVRDQRRNRACNSSDMRVWALTLQLGRKPVIATDKPSPDKLSLSVARRVKGFMWCFMEHPNVLVILSGGAMG